MTTLKNTSSLEKTLWQAAAKLRKNIDATQYKNIVLGLIFLKYISDKFGHLNYQLKTESEGQSVSVHQKVIFFVPPKAHYNFLQQIATQPTIGHSINQAMTILESENPALRGVLPKIYTHPTLNQQNLGALINLIGDITVSDTAMGESQDILGRVYEYFLGQFALTEGRRGGQFYTPQCIVKLLVAMLEPYQGRIFDPCCGSGGMFIQSEKFIKHHQGQRAKMFVYGQESNQTTWRLCKMNLAIRGIDSTHIQWNNEGSLLNDAHPELKADFILANPPFNDKDWGGALLQQDKRWIYGLPRNNNANFAWVQHIMHHLAPGGRAAFVLSNGSLSSKIGGEQNIRQKLVTNNWLECIVTLPAQLFYNTSIPACLWFIRRGDNKTNSYQREAVLFIDASDLGTMVNRRHRVLSETDINRITHTYHTWLKHPTDYTDIKGFCKSATLTEIEQHNFALIPRRYVGLAINDDDGLFETQIKQLTTNLKAQMKKATQLDDEIKTQLAKVGIKL